MRAYEKSSLLIVNRIERVPKIRNFSLLLLALRVTIHQNTNAAKEIRFPLSPNDDLFSAVLVRDIKMWMGAVWEKR